MLRKIKNFLSQYDKPTLAFLCIFISFIAVGLFTLGGFNGTGKSFTMNKNSSVVYELSMTEDQKHLKDVYINVGNIYKSAGSKATLSLYRSSSEDGKSWIKTSLGDVTVYNVISAEEENRNFNWIPAFTDKNISSSYKYIKVSSDCDMQLNEIIFVGDDGKVIPAKVNSKLSEISSAKSAAATLDRQGSFYKNSSSMFRFSQSEAYVISTINNIKLGSSYSSDAEYVNTSSFGAIGIYLIMLGSLVFGNGTFGMRIIPFIASAVSLLILYKLMKRVFKGRAAVFAFCYALSGVTLSVGRLALPYSISVCFIACSIYFMSGFLRNGISSAHMIKSSLNILLSGVFFSLGLAVYPPFSIAYLIVFVLFALGMIKQKKTVEYRLKKLSDEYAEKMKGVSEKEKSALKEEGIIKTKKEIVAYKKKNDAASSSFLLGFVAVFLTAFAAVSLSSYNYMIKSDGNPAAGGNAFFMSLKQFLSAFDGSDSTMYSTVNFSSPFGWFISLKGATLLSASSGDFYMALNANMNIALALFSFVSLAYSAAYLVKNFKIKDREYKIFARNFLLIFGGLICSLIPMFFIKNCSAVQSLLFSVFYMSFIPLASGITGKKYKKAMIIAAAAISAVFILETPMIFCYKVPVILERIAFGWTSILNNGFYRV